MDVAGRFRRAPVQDPREIYALANARKLWRAGCRLLGKRCALPPQFTGRGTSYPYDFTIQPLASAALPWPPDVILAVCRP